MIFFEKNQISNQFVTAFVSISSININSNIIPEKLRNGRKQGS
jgi:hypothetical protein